MMGTSKALEWLKGVAVGGVLSLRIDAEPSPVTRQVSRQGRIYHGARYAKFYAEAQRQIAVQATALGELEGQLAGPVAVVVESICARPKTTKRLWPAGDADNLAKGPTDAVTKAGLWSDDDQVIHLLTSKRFAQPGEEPGVNLHIARLA